MALRTIPSSRLRMLSREREGLPVCGHLSTTGLRCTQIPRYSVSIDGKVRYYLCRKHGNRLATIVADHPNNYPYHRIDLLPS